MLIIGEFSKISIVSTKTLRYYDEIVLLKPFEINQDNGYRYYELSQLEEILMIKKLKLYRFSLDEIQDIMNNLRDHDYLLTKLNKKKNEVDLEVENLYRLTDKIKEDILSLERGINIMEYNKEIKVEIINMPSQSIVSIRRKIAIEEFPILIGQVYNLLMEKGLTPIGGPMSIYHDEEFKPVDYDVEVAIPVKEKQGSTRILDGGLCAKAVLKGNYENLSYIYGYLNKWMEDNSYKISGAPYEVYLTDPSKTKEDENITEVYFPVFK